MSKGSANRDLYFQRHIKSATSAEGYIQALRNSPYRTHRRMSVLLQAQLERLTTAQAKLDLVESLTGEEKQLENPNGIEIGGDQDNGGE